jgi:hypothetical protein
VPIRGFLASPIPVDMGPMSALFERRHSKRRTDVNGNGNELTDGWPSHDIRRIDDVQARDQLAQFTQVLVGEQQMLARGLHVAEGPQQAAPHNK